MRMLRNFIYNTIIKFISILPAYFSVRLMYIGKRKNGEKIYRYIISGKNIGHTVFLCPYKGTGDVYIAAAYFAKCQHGDYTFCVVGGSNKKIAEMFNIDNIVSLKENEMLSLLKFTLFVGLYNANIKLLHPDALTMHTGIIDNMRNYRGLNFLDILGYCCFGVAGMEHMVPPNFSECNDSMETLFREYNLKQGKTVLIAPISNTLDNLPNWFWVKLVIVLKQHGFSVCTNVVSGKEKEIDGTVPIFLQYKDLKCFLEMAGYFIGIRSGLCDIVSSISCKKIIIYQPLLFWGEGSCMDYFSLNKMGLCDDAIELQQEGIGFIKLIHQIEDSIIK